MARSKQSTQEIGGRLRELRRQTGLTQSEVAEKVGVAPESVSRIERGRLAPSRDSLRRFAEALGVPEAALFDAKPVTVREPTLRPVERRLLALVKNVPDEGVEDIIRGLRILLDAGRDHARKD